MNKAHTFVFVNFKKRNFYSFFLACLLFRVAGVDLPYQGMNESFKNTVTYGVKDMDSISNDQRLKEKETNTSLTIRREPELSNTSMSKGLEELESSTSVTFMKGLEKLETNTSLIFTKNLESNSSVT